MRSLIARPMPFSGIGAIASVRLPGQSVGPAQKGKQVGRSFAQIAGRA